MQITIHQPEHIPWLGFFHKVSKVDTLVFLDNVQFRKNYYQNRNKIRTARDWQWITVPVTHSLKTLIQDVAIVPDSRWKKKWSEAIYFAYKKSGYFDAYYNDINDTVRKEWANLCDLNISLIKLLCRCLRIAPTFIKASQLNVEGTGSDLILNICKALKATVYLSGVSGKEYLDLDNFAQENIKVVFQEFHHPIYQQLYAPFVPCMSVIDLLFNQGDKSPDIINGINTPVTEKFFSKGRM